MQRVEHNFKAMGGPCGLRLETDDGADTEVAITAAVVMPKASELLFLMVLSWIIISDIVPP